VVQDPLLDVQRKDQASWLASAEAKVQELAAMPDGWDGHGSRRIQPTSSATMVRMLHAIATMDIPPPHISPPSGGALQIEWSLKNRDLEIVTYSDGSIHYLQSGNDDEDDMRDGALLAGDDAALRGLLVWLVGR